MLDRFGRVIGVAVGYFKDGQNLNFAIPVSKLAALLKPENDLDAGFVSQSKVSQSVPNELAPEGQLVNSGGGRIYYISRARVSVTPELFHGPMGIRLRTSKIVPPRVSRL